ncbi:MAG: alpha/beta hydrolase [Betaproteobacteria bacterium]
MKTTRSCLALALAATTLCAGANAGAEAFAQADRLVAVGAQRLNLHCSGSGSPTVVFEAPSGEAGWTWWAVQPAVAATTRACTYDRPGFGFSDPARHAGSSANAVDDLHALLAAAGVAPPYVLVGNSLGGANVQLYAYRYPAEVAGLVLVEAMHEDERARLDKARQGKLAALEAEEDAGARACAAEAEKPPAARGADFAECTGGPHPGFPPAIGAVDLASRQGRAYWRAALSEHDAFDADRAQLRAARKPFGDLPLIVLARTVSPWATPGKPQSDTNKATEAENLAMQREVSALSTRGQLRLIERAGHLVQDDRPDAVVQAVADLLAQARR